jgi:hypothetical protein
MTAMGPLCWLGWLGTALLMLTIFTLLLNVPATVDKTRIVRVTTPATLTSSAYFAPSGCCSLISALGVR